MDASFYRKVLEQAHLVRLFAQGLAADGSLDAAIDAIASADTLAPLLDARLFLERVDAMREDEATLRAVRELARLDGGQGLAGEGVASEPRPGARPANGSDLSADAPSPAEPAG